MSRVSQFRKKSNQPTAHYIRSFEVTLQNLASSEFIIHQMIILSLEKKLKRIFVYSLLLLLLLKDKSIQATLDIDRSKP